MTEATFNEASLLPRLPFTKELRTVLQGLSAAHPVGLGAAPRAGATYFILYPGWAQTSGGGWNTPDADVDWYYQVRCVAEAVDQIEWMRDRLTKLVLGRRRDGAYLTPIGAPGISVMSRWLEDDTGIPNDSSGSVFQSDLRFGFKVTPSG